MTRTLGSNWSKMKTDYLKNYKWPLIKIIVFIYCGFLTKSINCYEFNDVNPKINEKDRWNNTPRRVRSSVVQDSSNSNHVTYPGKLNRFKFKKNNFFF